MKYLFMLYDDENKFHSLSAAEQQGIVAEHMAFSAALRAAGAMIEGAPLDHSKNAKRARRTKIEDGPFTDSKEQIGGFYMIEAPDLDAALDWAARCPSASYGKVEVRPVWNIGA